jgi:putative SOS response-associated peptidase YedK
MCGRLTQSYTWRELVELYRLTQPALNLRPRYNNIAPTTAISVVRPVQGGLELVSMRWGLIPGWWKKTVKEVPSTFNAQWKDPQAGETIVSCTLIVTSANDFTRPIHDRMPVLLGQQDHEAWLAGKTGAELLRPAPNDFLRMWPVSRRVNKSGQGDDDPSLIEPVEAIADGQTRAFSHLNESYGIPKSARF